MMRANRGSSQRNRSIKALSACIAGLLLQSIATSAMAGGFIGSLGSGSSLNNQDFILHPSGYYNGDGTALDIKLCIVPGTPNAAAMVVPIANIAAKMNAQMGRAGNLVNGDSGDAVPFSKWDFESVALHEVGHCMGLAHVNAASESGLPSADMDYTKAAVGANAVLNVDDGADNRRGSKDDLRTDDVSVHWFRKGTNDPCADPGTTIFDSTTYTVNGALPAGDLFAANADEDVCSDLGSADTEAVMQQGSPNGQSQRFLGHDDAAMLRLAMSGLDEIQDTSDDYTLAVSSLGISDSEECDINLSFNDAQTGFAVCWISYGTFNSYQDHGVIVSADAYFNTTAVDWLFNTTGPPDPPSSYSVGGFTIDLLGSGLVLETEGQFVQVNANGNFTFPDDVADGANYEVTVFTQPTNPSQTCLVSNGTGTVDGGPVTDVEVTCETNTFPVGGTVSGLTGSGLVLQNNFGDDLSVTTNGQFTFSTLVPNGGSYNVTVKTQPTDLSQTCDVTNGGGTMPSANVTNVQVICTTNTYSVGGNVNGLLGSGLVLLNNGGDDETIAADGGFVFDTKLTDGNGYAVTVKTQPTNPGQKCEVSNGGGTLAGADVTNVAVTCAITCNVVMIEGQTEVFDETREACEILVLGPDYIVGSPNTVTVSAGWEIDFLTGFMVEQGATLDAKVCGQSLCIDDANPMPDNCHPCVTDICAIDAACCGTEWDQDCVDQVGSVCGLVCE